MNRIASGLNMVFIIGIGRSGTTVLTQQLNNFSSLHCMPEANFLLFFLQTFKNKTEFSEEDIELIFSEISTYSGSHPWVGWEFDIASVKQKVKNLCLEKEIRTYEDLCKFIYKEFKVPGKDKSAAAYIIDKNPSYTIYTSQIHKAFPEARFIYLVRDYRANVLSRKQSVYLRVPDVAFNAFRWKMFNRSALRFFKNNTDKVLLLKYEDFVAHPEPETLRILDFLGVRDRDIHQNKEAVLDLSSFDVDPKYKDRFNKKYSDLNRPVNSSRLNSWQTELSAEEIKLCDAVCGDFATEFNYEPFTVLSAKDKLKIKTKHWSACLKAFLDVKKDLLIYYLPAKLKLKRLKTAYAKLGFIKE